MRNEQIDISRAIGILLVVLGHNWLIAHDHASLAFRMVFSFHMPLFFFLSGVFLNAKASSSEFFLQRADALLKPYFVVLLMWAVLRSVFQHLPFTASLLGILYASGFTIDWTPLWFLPQLFLALTLARFCLLLPFPAAARNRWLGTLGLLLLAGGWQLLQWQSGPDALARLNWLQGLPFYQAGDFAGLPWSLDLLPFTTSMVLAGSLLRRQVLNVRWQLWQFSLAAALFVGLHLAFHEQLDLHMRVAGNLLVLLPQAVCGIFLCLQLAAGLAASPLCVAVLGYTGRYSLVILLFHSWLEWKLFGLLQARLGADLPAALLALLAGVCLPLGLAALLQACRPLGRLILPVSNWKQKSVS